MPPDIKTPAGDAPVIPLLLLGLGGYLAWFGVHYWRDSSVKWPSEPVKSVLQGKGVPGAARQQTETAVLLSDITAATGTGGTGGGAPGAGQGSIAANAQSVAGHCYSFGGAPGKDGTGCWDCSSCANWVVGKMSGLAIPGYSAGTYDGTVHGPTTISWLLFGAAVARADVAAGDLVVYETHMGIATSNTEMISAEDPQNGTAVSEIDGMTSSLGETAHFRRLS